MLNATIIKQKTEEDTEISELAATTVHNTTLANKSLIVQTPEIQLALTAASTLAGESPLGSANMEMTLIMMVSTVWIGSHRSSGLS